MLAGPPFTRIASAVPQVAAPLPAALRDNPRPIQRRLPVTSQELLDFAGRNYMLALGLAGVTVAIIYTEVARLLRPYKALRPAELTHLINREDATVIDLSAASDFDKGRIAGSRNVPVTAFKPDHKALSGKNERPVVLVCRAGTASATAAATLSKAGFAQVYWLDGGIAAWQQADLPLVKGRS